MVKLTGLISLITAASFDLSFPRFLSSRSSANLLVHRIPVVAAFQRRTTMTASSQRVALAIASGDSLFGRFVIPSDCVFYRSKFATAFVNLRPIVSGHVLVMSNRCVPRLAELNDEEYVDVWTTVRRVQEILQLQMQQQQSEDSGIDPNQPQKSMISFNVAIQDGVAAGQSVPHVHVHILPRVAGDYARNDDIYQDLEQWSPRLVPESQSHTAQTPAAPILAAPIHVPDVRRDRTVDEMAQEAALYRRIVETSRL
jgi:bis(5'-adenosyl)-triphosphatase